MKTLLKFLGLSISAVVVLGLITFAIFYRKVENKRVTPIPVTVGIVPVPTDEASIREGERLVKMKGCAECHGEDLGGKAFIKDPAMGTFTATNLTTGNGSAVFDYADSDWVRSIRYALGTDGRPLLFMPAGDFHGISQADLGKMIAYLKALPPVDRQPEATKMGPLAYVLANLGQLPLLFPFEEVALNQDPVIDVKAAENLEFGKYLAQACIGCHGPGFAGGPIPGVPPHWPVAKNLTPQGRMAQWSYEDFKKALTQGLTPDGHQMDTAFMPWKALAAMNETEIKALYIYLKQVPGKADGTR